MELWTEDIFQRVAEKCCQDEEYQKVLAECREKERFYRSVLAQLTEQQRQIIDDYVAVCEELEFQFSRVAFECALERDLPELLSGGRE